MSVVAFLESPLFALAVTLLLGVLAVSGKFSQNAAQFMLAGVWAVGSLAILRTGMKEFRPLVASSLILAGFCFLLSYWIRPATPVLPPTVHMSYSLKVLTPQESALFLNVPLEPGYSFYRFQITNNSESDISDVRVALDLPALLSRQPITIDHSFTDNLTVKPVFSAYTRTPLGKKTVRISGLSNAVIVEISRLRQSGMVDLGFVTAPIKERRVITATAPDGSVNLGVAPIYDRYGSVSVRRPVTQEGKIVSKMESFPVNYPVPNAELIDMARPLRPESRSVLFLMTQGEMLQAMKEHIDIHMEQHFQ